MSFLRLGVIKQHKTKSNLLKQSLSYKLALTQSYDPLLSSPVTPHLHNPGHPVGKTHPCTYWNTTLAQYLVMYEAEVNSKI